MAAHRGLVAIVALGLAGIAAGIDTRRESADARRSSLRKDESNVTHRLVICNAYASPKALDVYTLSDQMKLTVQPLAYKKCRELSLELQEGERLDFRAAGLSVGTFHAIGLPKTSAKLLLVPRRHSATSLAVAFDSHAFTDAPHVPQLAVVDAFIGSAGGGVQIKESGRRKKADELKANSVVALSSGSYQVTLQDDDNKVVGSQSVKVGEETKHVVMRVGVEGSYAQELVVFPGMKDSSSSTRVYPLVGTLAMTAACLLSAA